MKQWLTFMLVLMLSGVNVKAVFAAGADFTKEQIAQIGKHCVHGFWLNEQTVIFYAGDTAELNRDLPKFLEGQYATRKVVVHAGIKKAESPWDQDLGTKRETLMDWSVNTYDDPSDALEAVPRMHMQIDVWLGSKIQLEDLRIPEGFEVVSGGEIEKFIQSRKHKTK